jgi:hypothetical protein
MVVLLLMMCSGAYAQQLKTKNLVIVTLDGYRWQELFEGADPKLFSDESGSSEVIQSFQASDGATARERLMPFVWNVIAQEGQLYGNRNYDNRVNCSNHHLLSYPGYSEMLVGFPAKDVSSNDKSENPNATVLEFIHKHKGFHNRVAAFATWDVFGYILREEKADFHINTGNDLAHGKISDHEKQLNAQQVSSGTRSDEHTFQFALEYMKRERPRVVFIGFDETDQHGHKGRYDLYLKAAHDADQRIAQLWKWIQSQPDYRDQTTLLITTDHGRGKGKNSWKNHRLTARGSRHIWFAVIGPDTPAFGELKFNAKYYQKQVAKTVAAFLGIRYTKNGKEGEIVQTMIASPFPGRPHHMSETTRMDNSR